MNARPAPVVRLEGPLALGHGCISSLRMAVAARRTRAWCTRTNATAVVKLWSCSSPARSRKPVAAVSPTFGRLFEGTDVISSGQTALSGRLRGVRIHWRHNCHATETGVTITVIAMPQNGWHLPRKLLASAKAVSDSKRAWESQPGGWRRSESRQHRLTGLPADPIPSADMLRGEDDCPVHICG
jgi:hypothetical protein